MRVCGPPAHRTCYGPEIGSDSQVNGDGFGVAAWKTTLPAEMEVRCGATVLDLRGLRRTEVFRESQQLELAGHLSV